MRMITLDTFHKLLDDYRLNDWNEGKTNVG